MLKSIVSFLSAVMLMTATGWSQKLISAGDTWRYYKGSSMPPTQSGVAWNQLVYNDSTWGGPSPSGFGYGDGDDATTFSDMRFISGTQAGYASAYIRKSLAVADPAAITYLTLGIDYDDGFVAYLNGMRWPVGKWPLVRRTTPRFPLALRMEITRRRTGMPTVIRRKRSSSRSTNRSLSAAQMSSRLKVKCFARQQRLFTDPRALRWD